MFPARYWAEVIGFKVETSECTPGGLVAVQNVVGSNPISRSHRSRV